MLNQTKYNFRKITIQIKEVELMDDRIIGAALIIVGLAIAGFGGTMSTIESAIFYVVGFLVAFAGLGFFVKYKRKTSITDADGN